MDILITATVFNPKLRGKAVYVAGHDIDGQQYDRVFLVKDIDADYITLVNSNAEVIENIHLENFTHENEPLKLKILEDFK